MTDAACLIAGGSVDMQHEVHQEVWTSSMTNDVHRDWVTEILRGRPTIAAAIDVT